MNKALAANGKNGSVGSVELFGDHVLLFRLEVPGPVVAMPVGGGPTAEQTKWSGVSLDFASITADLKSLNEDTITEQPVFSMDGVRNYKVGDEGDMIEVDFNTTGGSKILVCTIDRAKLAKLPPGEVTDEQLGEVDKTVTGSMIVFTDRNAAREFEKALRVAIVIAKAQ